MSEPEVIIELPLLLWARLVFDMRKRGLGRRESGAFLIGQQTNSRNRVRKYICYDDLDPHAYTDGAITFHAQGYAALWERCKSLGMELLADLHTHPGRDTRQSHIDQRHPMVPVIGHTAMIMPNFGHTSWWSLSGVGIYEYLGNFQWRQHTNAVSPPRVKLTLW